MKVGFKSSNEQKKGCLKDMHEITKVTEIVQKSEQLLQLG
jgi:hypothetical protein